MNKAQTDKQFALIVEDFYDDYETTEAYSNSYTSRADVFSRKLAFIVIVAMLAITAITYVVQNPMAIPALVAITVTIVFYRKMTKDYAKKNKA